MSDKCVWKDTTSYSRDEKNKIPTCYSLNTGALKISVTCGHIYHKPDWVMHCFDIGINTKPLKANNLESAKKEALLAAKKSLTKMIESLKEIEVREDD